MSRSHRTSSGTITPNHTLEQTHAAMQAIAPAIKTATDAKAHLYKKGWAFLGKEITLKILTRTLFAVIADNKITSALANPILSVAYLITEKLEENATLNITTTISTFSMHSFR